MLLFMLLTDYNNIAAVISWALLFEMLLLLPSFLEAIGDQWNWQLFGLRFDVVDVVLFFAMSLFCCFIAARRTQRIRLYGPEEFANLGFQMIGCKAKGSAKSWER